MFETELAYFKAHQDELVRRHEGCILVIVGEQVRGAYPDAGAAYRAAAATMEPGSFMLQRCIPGPEAYTASIATLGMLAA
jgi:hypothetical protein